MKIVIFVCLSGIFLVSTMHVYAEDISGFTTYGLGYQSAHKNENPTNLKNKEPIAEVIFRSLINESITQLSQHGDLLVVYGLSIEGVDPSADLLNKLSKEYPLSIIKGSYAAMNPDQFSIVKKKDYRRGFIEVYDIKYLNNFQVEAMCENATTSNDICTSRYILKKIKGQWQIEKKILLNCDSGTVHSHSN